MSIKKKHNTMNWQLHDKVEIPPLNPWNSSPGRNSSPVGNHWLKTFSKNNQCWICSYDNIFSGSNFSNW